MSILVWVGFVGLVLIFLALDLGVFHRRAHVVALREAFGWTVYEINGHDLNEIAWALDPDRVVPGKPTIVVARTVKAYPISFMAEAPADFHGKAPNDEELERALAELA